MFTAPGPPTVVSLLPTLTGISQSFGYLLSPVCPAGWQGETLIDISKIRCKGPLSHRISIIAGSPKRLNRRSESPTSPPLSSVSPPNLQHVHTASQRLPSPSPLFGQCFVPISFAAPRTPNLTLTPFLLYRIDRNGRLD